MNDSVFTIRNYRTTDFRDYLHLNIAAEELEPIKRYISSQTLREKFERPNYSPEQDLFLIVIAGKLIGYIDLLPELAIRRVIINCWVYPEYRRQGIATKLLHYALQRAKKLGAEVAHIEIPRDKAVARRILTKLGFRLVRRLLHLELNIAEVRQNDMEQAFLGCRYLQRGEEEILTKIQNRSFAGIWGYNPNTVTEISYRINLSNRQDILLTYDGDRVTGYSWMEIIEDKEATSAAIKGRIFMLGVDPDYRSKAMGKKALLAGLAHLKNHDVTVAEITVDSENKVARALYQKIGFKIITSSLWYEKQVNQVTGAK